ncbi:hypothetical protein JR316_0012234 [Psilocybe cubensis]|uniref:Uncharacterized protein n=1 Tax=Psilocybe cubensis TaxID=181762 RepID=A0ACB8GHT7_PSICU|nr:hypothetical protein JR316_0012234 [Psilocybe cubensis]KAH9475123.1 hypothetical protein JR316_0012234 [Psilocybe cubensis]
MDYFLGSSLPATALKGTIENTLGAGFLGLIAASIVLDATHLAITIHGLYYYIIQQFGNVIGLQSIIWSFKVSSRRSSVLILVVADKIYWKVQITLNVIIIIMVQSLYTLRVWKLGGHNFGSTFARFLPIGISIIVLGGAALALYQHLLLNIIPADQIYVAMLNARRSGKDNDSSSFSIAKLMNLRRRRTERPSATHVETVADQASRFDSVAMSSIGYKARLDDDLDANGGQDADGSNRIGGISIHRIEERKYDEGDKKWSPV